MKVIEILTEGNQVHVILEPEHPAEIALLKLMDGCNGHCAIPPAKDGGVSATTMLQMSVDVKKGNRY
jgi:hypothetical protein